MTLWEWAVRGDTPEDFTGCVLLCPPAQGHATAPDLHGQFSFLTTLGVVVSLHYQLDQIEKYLGD